MDASGDDGLEFLFPKYFSTRAPVQVSAATHVPDASDTPTLTNTITTTIIRLKDFVLTRVVDFLEANLLIIIVVTSLLIVMVFIICCASAMSQKRKLAAYKAPPQTSTKYAAEKNVSSASPKNLRMPSKALVGERGRDVKSSPRPEVRKVREVEEVENRREETKHKEQTKRREEVQHTSSQPVCTCHLKKA
uniref:Uncharacterized LOC109510991 n=1 Tax=Hippocampus comes TaxID=109280 RepID=A0A3Q2YVR6_HIPCM